jgi:hypothetical protein
MKLDAKAAATLAPAGKADHIFFDDVLTGFGLRVRASGRSWVIQYRHGGRTRRLRLGNAAVLGAEQARALAKRLLASAAMGEDPAADRSDRRQKDRMTLGAIARDYMAARGPSANGLWFWSGRRRLLPSRCATSLVGGVGRSCGSGCVPARPSRGRSAWRVEPWWQRIFCTIHRCGNGSMGSKRLGRC